MSTEYVVAIDLGTSCTAYSWKSLRDQAPLVGVPDMEPGEEIFGKSPTSLLVLGDMRADKEFSAQRVELYGRQAEECYATNAHPNGSQLFKRFKMVGRPAVQLNCCVVHARILQSKIFSLLSYDLIICTRTDSRSA